jgi:hypothetical protein
MGVMSKLFGGNKSASGVDVHEVSGGAAKCPSCKHEFEPPRITFVTQDVVNRYGPNPVQCPNCQHIWSRK